MKACDQVLSMCRGAKKVLLADAPLCVMIIDSADAEVDIFLSQNGGCPPSDDFRCVDDKKLHYNAFCDDFGPMNMLSIFQFVDSLDHEIQACQNSGHSKLVCAAANGRRALTNTAFLLGSYMILKLDQSPEQVQDRFDYVDHRLFEAYRDATFSAPDFRLSLLDCWKGLHKGKMLAWISIPSRQSTSKQGKIDKDLYELYANPLNADLNEVVPQKFAAFRGPKDLKGELYRDNYQDRSREFDPAYYLEIFEDLHVSTVIRLNEASSYPLKVYSDNGIQHNDLYFDNCTAPPPHIVKRFFEIVDNASGMVAMHCKTGLGRTGTLIGLFMMRTYGFTAREAIGWLRIMRPGSVIGVQQHWLCCAEERLQTHGFSHWLECDFRVVAPAITRSLRDLRINPASGLQVDNDSCPSCESREAPRPKSSESPRTAAPPRHILRSSLTQEPSSCQCQCGGPGSSCDQAHSRAEPALSRQPIHGDSSAPPAPGWPRRPSWATSSASQLVSVFSRRLGRRCSAVTISSSPDRKPETDRLGPPCSVSQADSVHSACPTVTTQTVLRPTRYQCQNDAAGTCAAAERLGAASVGGSDLSRWGGLGGRLSAATTRKGQVGGGVSHTIAA